MALQQKKQSRKKKLEQRRINSLIEIAKERGKNQAEKEWSSR